MIDFAGLVGKITGKSTTQADRGLATGTEAGIATGGEFAELVRLATQAEAGRGQGNLRLVVDNGIAPPLTGVAVAAMAPGVGVELMPATSDAQSPATEKDGETDGDSQETSDSLQPNPFALPAYPGAAIPVPVMLPATTPAPAATATMKGQTPIAANQPAMPTAPASTVVGQDVAETAGVATILAAGEAPQEVKPGVLIAAWRMLAPRQRGAATADKADMAAQLPITATASTDGRTADTASGFATAGKSPAATAPMTTGETLAAVSSPLRTIVETLPPVIQSELGTPTVQVVAGPSTGPSIAESLGDQVIDMGVSGQWIDRMAREIAGLADGTGHSRFTLSPPHLGRLQVDLWRDEGTTNVRMLTETDEAAQRLNEGRSALQADARVAALSLGTIIVEKSSGAQDSATRDQGGQRQGSDLFGQQADGQAQSRAGNGQGNGQAHGQNGAQGNGQGSDWVSRIAVDEPNQQDEASSRAPGRAANGRVRFA